MKNNKLFLKTFVLLVALFSCQITFAQFLGGDGTVSNPYQINNRAGLEAVQNYLSSNFIVTADIDLAGADWTPIGTQSTPFSGTFNGNGKRISNMTISNGAAYSGFFSVVENGTIKNVWLHSVNITGSDNTGGLIGQLNDGVVMNCRVSGTIGGSNFIGAIIGSTFNTELSTVTDCFADGSVTAFFGGGGIIGQAKDKTVIQRCIYTGSVSAAGRGGGLIGYSGDDDSVLTPANTFSNSVLLKTTINRTVTWSGEDHFNCIVGTFNPGVLSNNLASEEVSFVGTNHIVNSGLDTKDGLTKTVEDLKLQSTYEAIDYKFGSAEETPWSMNSISGYPDLWYTIVKSNFAAGDGSTADPYQITNKAELENVRSFMGSNFKLMNDIDFAGTDWTPVAGNFTGTFNGNGKKISNINIPAGSLDKNIALFSVVAGGTIKNLWIDNATLTAGHESGILVGKLDGGTISNCAITNSSITAKATGLTFIGGMVGLTTANGGTISDCYINVNVGEAFAALGGLIGQAYDKTVIQRCIVGGSVSSHMRAGGVIGYSGDDGTSTTPTNLFSSLVLLKSTITRANAWSGEEHYNAIVGTFNPGTLQNNLTSEEVTFEGTNHVLNSGLDTKDGLTQTVEQLQTKSTYSAIGYSFGTTENNPWSILAGQYPVLWYMVSNSGTGIDLSNSIKLSIYPNPVTEVLNINTENSIKQVLIYDITGRLVIRDNQSSVPVKGLPSGNYFVKVTTNVGDTVVRIIKR
ncbi:T9SS type A sorting domain-containing protein [Bacteroides sedimenti]|uniref:Secretion system C-terminal sorting domain-containing protein n=1 Tax=Bacteroides sedimenti TaxID=2136147 RepID=A0ABM8ICJ6_9BACE